MCVCVCVCVCVFVCVCAPAIVCVCVCVCVHMQSSVCVCVCVCVKVKQTLVYADRKCLELETRQQMKVGQVYYLVSMQWWNTWLEYVNVGVSPYTVSIVDCQ